LLAAPSIIGWTTFPSNGDAELGSIYILVLFSRRRLPSFCLYKRRILLQSVKTSQKTIKENWNFI
jgi:hypothetical protein